MPRPSALQQFLNRLPSDKKEEAIRLARSAPTGKQAYKELKKLGYKASYDAVVNWRVMNSGSRIQNPDPTTKLISAAAVDASSASPEVDPIGRTMDLSKRLNRLVNSLTALLEEHDWLEGEMRLSNREAFKILSAIPSLARASSGTIIELNQIKAKYDEKALCLGILEELREDWHKLFQSESPEILPLLEMASDVTLARLQLSESNVLEEYCQKHGIEQCLRPLTGFPKSEEAVR